MPDLSEYRMAEQLRQTRALAAAAHARLADISPMPTKMVAAAWRHFETQFVDASDRAAQNRIASAALAAMRAFAELSYAARGALQAAEIQIERHGYVAAVAEAADAVLAEDPVLGPLKIEMDRAAADFAAQVAQREAANAAAAAAQFPPILLERLRRCGVHLALDPEGRVAAPANQPISANDRQVIIDHYDGIAAALKAEAEAARLVPVK